MIQTKTVIGYAVNGLKCHAIVQRLSSALMEEIPMTWHEFMVDKKLQCIHKTWVFNSLQPRCNIQNAQLDRIQNNIFWERQNVIAIGIYDQISLDGYSYTKQVDNDVEILVNLTSFPLRLELILVMEYLVDTQVL